MGTRQEPDYASDAYRACLYGQADKHQQQSAASQIALLHGVKGELTRALEDLLTYDRVERPAFRTMPVGSPHSTARIQQDKLIALEDAALAALAKAKAP